MSSENGKKQPQVFESVLIDCDKILPSEMNKRRKKNENIDGLTDSIKSQGLLQPIHIRKHPSKEGMFEIVTGERRHRACSRLFKQIPAVVRELTDQEAHEIRIVENLQREDLTPLEEAENITDLISMGKETQDIADRLGRPEGWVVRRAKLVNLSPAMIKAFENEKCPVSTYGASHLEVVARFPHEIQDEILENHLLRHCEPMTISEIQDICDKNFLFKLSMAPWMKQESEGIVLETGNPMCIKCQNRTSAQMNLFGEIESKASKRDPDRCIDATCYRQKMKAYIEQKAASQRAANPDIVLLDKGRHGSSILPDSHQLKQGSVKDYEVMTNVKKTDPKAKLALIIDGPGAGQMTWVKPYDSSKKLEGTEKTMAQKRKELEKRRTNKLTTKVIDLLHKLFDDPSELDLDAEDLIVLCIRLITRFGAFKLWKKIDEMEYRDEWKTSETSDKPEDLLRCILPVIRKELRGDQQSMEPDPKKAEQVCKWFQIDHKVLRKQVEEEVPVPKSWGKSEIADKKQVKGKDTKAGKKPKSKVEK